jgi:hypothetical protein
MDRFNLVRRDEASLVFESAKDLECAYELLKNGGELMVSWKEGSKIVSEIISPAVISDIVDKKLDFKSEEVKK